jgi:hypothetical protein
MVMHGRGLATGVYRFEPGLRQNTSPGSIFPL